MAVQKFHFLRFKRSDSGGGLGLVRSATREPPQSEGLLLQMERGGWVPSETEAEVGGTSGLPCGLLYLQPKSRGIKGLES